MLSTSTTTEVSSSVVAESAVALGGSLSGFTVTVTVAVFDVAVPSDAMYVKLSDPV